MDARAELQRLGRRCGRRTHSWLLGLRHRVLMPHNQRLLVLCLNDSFAALWPMLARECDLELELCDSTERLVGAKDAVGTVAAGGEEERLERIFRDISPTEMPVAAVGANGERRTVVATVRAGAADFFSLTDDLD